MSDGPPAGELCPKCGFVTADVFNCPTCAARARGEPDPVFGEEEQPDLLAEMGAGLAQMLEGLDVLFQEHLALRKELVDAGVLPDRPLPEWASPEKPEPN